MANLPKVQPNQWYENPGFEITPINRRNQTVNVMNATNRAYSEIRVDAESLGNQIADMELRQTEFGGDESQVGGMENFQRDCFASFYQNNVEQSGYGTELNQRLIDVVHADESFDAIRTNSSWEESISAMAALDVGGRAFGAVSDDTIEDMNDAEQKKNESDKSEAESDAAEQMADDLEQMAKESDLDQDRAEADSARIQANDARQKADQAKQAALQAIQKADESFKGDASAIRSAVKSASADANAMAQSLVAIGKMYGSQDSPIKGKELMELVKSVDINKIRKMADLVGSMTRLALTKQSTKTEHDAGAIVGIDFGSNPEKIMADELALLSHPVLKMDFMARFVNDSIMEFELELNEPQHQGPMVVCADYSSSMSGDEVACVRAFLIAMANIARNQKRDYAVIPFNTKAFDAIHFKANASGVDWKKSVDEVLKLQAAGGTRFDPPINAGLSIIENESEYDKADLVILTDGESHISDTTVDRVNTQKQSTGLSVFGVLIGGSGAMEVLKPIVDRVWVESEFGFETAGKVFGSV